MPQLHLVWVLALCMLKELFILVYLALWKVSSKKAEEQAEVEGQLNLLCVSTMT